MEELKSVSGLYIYPVKGLKGMALQEATCLEQGLAHDRQWMIVDAKMNFISQRAYPLLALIETRIEDDTIVLRYKNSRISIPLTLTDGYHRPVYIWGEKCSAFLAEKIANDWISSILGIPSYFAFMNPQVKRPVDERYALYQESVGFADGYPYLIIGEASLAFLNQKLKNPLPMDRFRPNIVIRGGEPHEEDTWGEFNIGSLSFYAPKPCARCNVITIDQETGVVGKEPLKTLATYRQKSNKILFGMNTLVKNKGTIAIGDKVTLLAT